MKAPAADAALADRARRILAALRKAYPDARVPLDYGSPLELLVGTILAAQCTDRKVNEVTPGLYARYRTASDWAGARLPDLEREIRPTGFFRNKARALVESAQDILARHGGEVPATMEELTSLRGVGRKTASVVLGYAFGKPAIIVDTHFIRLARRMGLSTEFAPEKIEADVALLLPKRAWTEFSLLMTWHGRATCTARKPACDACAVGALCPARASCGVITWKVRLPGAAGAARAKGRGGARDARGVSHAAGAQGTKAKGSRPTRPRPLKSRAKRP